MNNARAETVRLLLRTSEENSYSNLLLNAALGESGLDAQERALCTQLYYGVMERLLTLKHLLRVYSDKKPPEKLDKEIRYILYLGLYQLKYCDKIPDSAAVNESVKLTGIFRKKSASGFVNAILRKFQRAGKEIPLTSDKWLNQEILYSAPVPFLKKVTEEHGETFAKAFFEDSLQTPPCFIRVNPLRADEKALQELHPEKIDLLDGAYRIQPENLRDSEAFRKGMFHVQDLSSQLCCRILDPHPGETILDMCAAPGGKSFTIAERMNNQGHVYAFDLHPHRVKLIQDGAERLGLNCLHTQVQNAAHYQKDIPTADRILCDVPCSGLGVIRRKPEIKYKPLESFENLPEMQYQILENAAKYLRPGGILVYSTCTILKRENEDVIHKFLEHHPEFVPVPLTEFGFSQAWTTFSVSFADCDGFFAARLQRKAE